MHAARAVKPEGRRRAKASHIVATAQVNGTGQTRIVVQGRGVTDKPEQVVLMGKGCDA